MSRFEKLMHVLDSGAKILKAGMARGNGVILGLGVRQLDALIAS
ncbi:hypothetical protein [Nitrosococcus halophilus]|nr:hypothetical protein [Nitrosococcus halophilus]